MCDDAGLDRRVGDAFAVREAFDEFPVLLMVLDGPEHRFVAANAAYRGFAGRQELIGVPIRELVPEVAGQQLFEVLDRVHATGEAETAREWRLQVDRDGTGEPVDTDVDFTITPRRRSDGSIRGTSALIMDVTERVAERQAAQAEAIQAERRYEAARDVIVQLQRALLPAELPVLPVARVAARYLVAAQDQAAGGDWFDAIPLPDGRLGLVVGDVVGHGVTASAAMGQLRAVLGELLSGSGNLEEVLVRVDRLAASTPAMATATVCVAVLDPTTGELTYVTRGHPPPLVVTPQGTTRYLEPTNDPPLGRGNSPTIASVTLQPGEVLLAYSDGLIERPDQSLAEGKEWLAQVASEAMTGRAGPTEAPTSPAERVCQLSAELLARIGYDDDVTVLAVQRRPDPVQPWHLDLTTTDTERLGGVRARLRDWLAQVEPTQSDEDALQLAVTELVANATEHAYANGKSGPVRLRAELATDGVAHLYVADDGRWQQPDEPALTHGRGLWIAGSLVDELHVDQSPTGTLVTVRHRLTRPASLAAELSEDGAGVPDGGAGQHRRTAQFATNVEDGPPPTVTVSGPIDITTADDLAEQLARTSRGGLHPMIIDLTDVEILASAGVRMLFDVQDQLATYGHPLELVAAPGSPSRVVLDLVGLTSEARVDGARP